MKRFTCHFLLMSILYQFIPIVWLIVLLCDKSNKHWKQLWPRTKRYYDNSVRCTIVIKTQFVVTEIVTDDCFRCIDNLFGSTIIFTVGRISLQQSFSSFWQSYYSSSKTWMLYKKDSYVQECSHSTIIRHH